jgi:hypothetical protein
VAPFEWLRRGGYQFRVPNRHPAVFATEPEIPTWNIQFSVNGKQFRESTHTDSYNDAQKYLKRRITEVSTGKFHGTKVDRTLVSDLLSDVVADYQLKDRHSIDKMARPLIENRLTPYFGNMRATTSC